MSDASNLAKIKETIRFHFHVKANEGKIKHKEIHFDGDETVFEIIADHEHFAFTLDLEKDKSKHKSNEKGNDSPFFIFAEGYNQVNDLTIFCSDSNENLIAFVIECKKSCNPLKARKQIARGNAFCRFLCESLELKKYPHLFGIAAICPKTPSLGTTRPSEIAFKHPGKELLYHTWDNRLALPLRAFVHAASQYIKQYPHQYPLELTRIANTIPATTTTEPT